MLSDSPPDVEETPTPAVSSLRSKFEKLAVDSSPKITVHSFASSNDLLAPEPGSPRPRAMSNNDQRTGSPINTRALRPASSSSDLKQGTSGRKPPPPPPPRSRGSSPAASTKASPSLRPVPDPPSSTPVPAASLTPDPNANLAALLARKPPPPPHASEKDPFDDVPVGSVAARISQFR